MEDPAPTNSKVSQYIHTGNPEQVDMDGVKILAAEKRCFERGVREAIHIRMEQPSLNNDGCCYNPLSGTMC